MADEFEDGFEGDGEESFEGAGGGKKKSGKKKLFIILVPILLVIGGAAAVYFSGVLGPVLGGDSEEEMSVDMALLAKPAVFYDLPEMLVNMSSRASQPTYLKMRVSLEVPRQEDIQIIDSVIPRVVDNFQVYLRELRAEDIEGSAGMYRLREELLARVNAAVRPAEVTDVLFKEMLVQY